MTIRYKKFMTLSAACRRTHKAYATREVRENRRLRAVVDFTLNHAETELAEKLFRGEQTAELTAERFTCLQTELITAMTDCASATMQEWVFKLVYPYTAAMQAALFDGVKPVNPELRLMRNTVASVMTGMLRLVGLAG